MPEKLHNARLPFLGGSGFALGSISFILMLIVFWAGPFSPQQAVGISIGEMAADIAKSAARSMGGQPNPEPIVREHNIDDYLNILVSSLAGLAIVLGAAGMIRQENTRAAVSGIFLGLLTIAFQVFTYTVMMIAGALVLSAIIYSLRDFFSDILGG